MAADHSWVIEKDWAGDRMAGYGEVLEETGLRHGLAVHSVVVEENAPRHSVASHCGLLFWLSTLEVSWAVPPVDSGSQFAPF